MSTKCLGCFYAADFGKQFCCRTCSQHKGSHGASCRKIQFSFMGQASIKKCNTCGGSIPITHPYNSCCNSCHYGGGHDKSCSLINSGTSIKTSHKPILIPSIPHKSSPTSSHKSSPTSSHKSSPTSSHKSSPTSSHKSSSPTSSHKSSSPTSSHKSSSPTSSHKSSSPTSSHKSSPTSSHKSSPTSSHKSSSPTSSHKSSSPTSSHKSSSPTSSHKSSSPTSSHKSSPKSSSSKSSHKSSSIPPSPHSHLPPDNCKSLVPGKQGYDAKTTICFYNKGNSYYEFTNFFVAPIKIGGITYPTNEHYFQSQKFTGRPDIQKQIMKAVGPMDVFKIAQKEAKNADSNWASKKGGIMRQAVLVKFSTHAYLRRLLLHTGNKLLVEHTTNDKQWGDGGYNGGGTNLLGKILMEVRSTLKNTPGGNISEENIITQNPGDNYFMDKYLTIKRKYITIKNEI